MNRRTVLLALGAVMSGCGALLRGRRRPVPTEPVLVLGAGIAGLAAAATLRKSGFPVLLLEAQGRVGGRVHTVRDFAAQPIDRGAELIHGGSVASWDTVRALGLQTRPLASVLQYQGRVAGAVDPEPSASSMEAFAALVKALPEAEDLSVAEAFARLRPKLSQADASAIAKLLALDLDALRSSARALLAVRSDPHREGGDFMVRGGMGQLLAAFESDAEQRLGFVVEHVEVLADGVRATSRDGQVVRGSSAILTLPLGVLRQRAVRFTPPLPAEKERAIDGLGMTSAVKLFLRFPTRVLPEGVDAVLVPEGLPRGFWVTGFEGAAEQVLTGWAVHDDARALLAMGKQAALERALSTLRAEVSASLPEPLAMDWSEWESDP